LIPYSPIPLAGTRKAEPILWGEMTLRTIRGTFALAGAISLALAGCRAVEGEPTADERLPCSNIAAVVADLPLPEDAEAAAYQPDEGCVFATNLIEPQLFDFYTRRLQENGWRRQAPTEAMVTLPHQVWGRDDVELRIEIQGLDDQDRILVWLHALESEMPNVTPPA
jgi:hypothetical protein